jgi:arylsulfatase A-like enzyme
MRFKHFATVLFSILIILNACKEKQQQSRPNIIFIMSDDHAYQAISAYGHNLNQTPNIDRLAKEGVRFQNSFVTNSICAPSRAVMLTGTYNHINGLINNSVEFDTSLVTFPKLMQQNGYQTALFGKWHLKSNPQGFDYWNILPGQGHYYNPDFIEMGKKSKRTGYVTDLITDYFLDWMDSRDKEKPFCVLLHHKAPHRNWMPAQKYLTKYKNDTFPLPASFYDDYKTRSDAAKTAEMRITDHSFIDNDLKYMNTNYKEAGLLRPKFWKSAYNRLNKQEKANWDSVYLKISDDFDKQRPEGKELAEWKYQRYMQDYLACIASVDDNVGRVLDYLDKNNLTQNTIVVYTSDQGFYLGEHGWFDKRFMYEESFRTPLIVRYPKEIKPRFDDKDMVMNLDFAPTFLDYAGIQIPETMQGKSLRDVLNKQTPDDWRKSVYYHYYEYPGWHMVKRHYGIRTPKYKLIHFYYDIDAWELYDLTKDPNELNNLYNNPEYQDIIAELKTELQKLREQYKDTDEDLSIPPKPIEIKHLAVGAKVDYSQTFSKNYTGGGSQALVDGLESTDELKPPFTYKLWQGFEGNDLILIIDLGKQTELSSISCGFLQNQGDWIFLPEAVNYSVSENNKKYIEIANFQPGKPFENQIIIKKSYKQTFDKLKARYIKVYAKNMGLCPDWHKGAGKKAWIMADEIVVE